MTKDVIILSLSVGFFVGIIAALYYMWKDTMDHIWKQQHQMFMDIASEQVGCPKANLCYDWEGKVVGPKLIKAGLGNDMSIKEARAYIKKVCKHFGYKMPRVRESDFPGLPAVGMSINGNLILLKAETDRMVILHELAHMFLSQDGRPDEAHNEVFLERYIQLLEWAGITGLRRTLHAWALSPIPFPDTEVATTQHGNFV